MPELPEVQTIVNDLNLKIKGENIVSFWSDWKDAIKKGYRNFVSGIKGKKILKIERLGKNILLELSGGKTIIIHLRMTGNLLVMSNNKWHTGKFGKDYFDKRNKHVHHVFYLKSGNKIEFRDIRKFGSLELVSSENLEKSEALGKLGVDALSKKFTLQEFERILNGSKMKIKQLLLDQKKIAGIGNIYANEILFVAGILPQKVAVKISKDKRKTLFFAIKNVLRKAVKFRGTSVSDYRDASGKRGKFQNLLKVYQKTGQKCKRCGTIIRRSVIGQRSTFHCLKCQK